MPPSHTADATGVQVTESAQIVPFGKLSLDAMLDGDNTSLVAAGLSLHWLWPFKKNPIAKGWDDAPNQTVADLRASYVRGANIGLRPGEPSKVEDYYLHIIDLDIRDDALTGEAWSVLLEMLPDARVLPSVISGSDGESRHFYFVTDKPFGKKLLAQSKTSKMVFDPERDREVKKDDWRIELLGTGAQAVIPPSIHPDTRKSYRWERQLVLDFPTLMHVDAETVAGWGANESQSKGNDDDDLLKDVRSDPLDLDGLDLDRILADLPADWVEDRDLWVKVGQALHHQFEGNDEGFDKWCDWSRKSKKFDLKDSKRVWKSFGPTENPVTVATLIQAAGCVREKATSPGRLKFLTPEDCENTPAREYLIKGMIARQDVACIFGAPGAGKSLIAPFLGYMVAQGREAFGARTKQGGVLYIAAEDPHGMRGRVKALRRAHGEAQGFTLVEGVSQLLMPRGSTAEAPDLATVVAAVKERRPALIVIDTLAMAFPGLEENSAEDMGRVVAVARRLTRWGAAVVLIHHDTKAEGGTPRGHSVLNGAIDVGLHVKRDESGVIRGKLTKNRNGTCDLDLAFNIATEDGGLDEDGDTITLPRCNPLPAGAGRAKVKGPTGQAAAALKILEGMAQPAARDDWQRACIASDTVSANEDRSTRRKAFNRAVQTLTREGWVSSADGFYSICDGFDDLPVMEGD